MRRQGEETRRHDDTREGKTGMERKKQKRGEAGEVEGLFMRDALAHST